MTQALKPEEDLGVQDSCWAHDSDTVTYFRHPTERQVLQNSDSKKGKSEQMPGVKREHNRSPTKNVSTRTSTAVLCGQETVVRQDAQMRQSCDLSEMANWNP